MINLVIGKDVIDRLMKKVVINNENGCWEWVGGKSNKGYGNMCIGGGVKKQTHRISYTYFKGNIPSGLIICHKCDNPSCVNPDHLFAGTNSDNAIDCVNKGRRPKNVVPKGEENINSKLTEESVREIRMSTLKYENLAKQYGVSICIISKVKNRKYWTHVI